jgi:hypothetical protein
MKQHLPAKCAEVGMDTQKLKLGRICVTKTDISHFILLLFPPSTVKCTPVLKYIHLVRISL